MKKLLSVTLVDDDEISNALNLMTLEELGIAETINVFSDGEQAIEYLKSCGELISDAPELLIVDFNMPSLNGEELVLQFNTLPILNKSRIRIVIYSAILPGKKYEYLKSLGVDDFIEKPLTSLKVTQLIERLGLSVSRS